jgi:dsDNA-specific endonuclease/ATPase MutS2
MAEKKKYGDPKRFSYKVRKDYIKMKMRERYWKIKKGQKKPDKWYLRLMEQSKKSKQERKEVREFLGFLKQQGYLSPRYVFNVDSLVGVIQKVKKYSPRRFQKYESLLESAVKKLGWNWDEIRKRAGI